MPNFGSQDPGSWGWPRGDSADIVPFSFDGHNFYSGVARLAAPIFTAVLNDLVRVPGFRLRESKGVDAGMWGYENRRKGAGGWSFHAWGLAIDINAPDNPMSSQTPPAGPYRLPTSTQEIARRHGCLWGGGPEGFGDWMHIEVHLSPGEAGSVSAGPAKPAKPLAKGAFPLPAGYYYGPYTGPAESISGQGQGDAGYRAGLVAAQKKLHVPADGYYGPGTAAAIKNYQAKNGLTPDGLLGARTWALLKP